MKKIIEEGKKEFVTTCNICGTKFSYELNDIMNFGDIHPYVKCPVCTETCYHYVDVTPPTPPTTGSNVQKPYIDMQPTTDLYEKIPYWQRPEYKPPIPMC